MLEVDDVADGDPAALAVQAGDQHGVAEDGKRRQHRRSRGEVDGEDMLVEEVQQEHGFGVGDYEVQVRGEGGEEPGGHWGGERI